MPEADPFEPRMPDVDVPADIAEVFRKARAQVEGGSRPGLDPGQRCLGILTPGRMVMFVPAPKPGAVPAQFVEQVKKLLPFEKPLQITAVAFTALEALMKDQAKCIPHLGQLLGFAYAGHNVVVFEGHPSAFAFALPESDVLLIDSGMLPFLQKDWAEQAFRSLPPGARIRVYSRKSRQLLPVVKSANERGWRYGEPDGEASYTNCLLTTLAKRSPVPVRLTAGSPAPDLSKLALEPQELAWAAELPFKYDALDVAKVIAALQRIAKWPHSETGRLDAQLATAAGKLEKVSFQLRLGRDAEGHACLDLEKA
jgi:hypothetical protein